MLRTTFSEIAVVLFKKYMSDWPCSTERFVLCEFEREELWSLKLQVEYGKCLTFSLILGKNICFCVAC